MRAGLLVLLLAGHIAGQQMPRALLSQFPSANRITEAPTIRALSRDRRVYDAVAVRVIINAAGRVVQATAINGRRELFQRAEALEKQSRFEPFLSNGVARPCTFLDQVEVIPPERWLTPRVPFPKVRDFGSLRIRLKRRFCEGPCFLYSVEISGDGDLVFEGSDSTLVNGRHRGRLSHAAVLAILSAFQRADFFSLLDNYRTSVTDSRGALISIQFDGNHKTVDDYVGILAGIPDVARELEAAIDKVAGTEKWVTGNSETIDALTKEGWRPDADTRANRLLLSRALVGGQTPIVTRWLEEPKLPERLLACGMEGAAKVRDAQLLRRLLKRTGTADPPACSEETGGTVLMAALHSGYEPSLRELLRYGPNLDRQDRYGNTALTSYLKTGERRSSALVRLLVSNGANVNVRNVDGRTALFYACKQPEIVRTLLRVGADVNVQDFLGMTPIMACDTPESFQAMAVAGADLRIRTRGGLTALDLARIGGLHEKVALLDGYPAQNPDRHAGRGQTPPVTR